MTIWLGNLQPRGRRVLDVLIGLWVLAWAGMGIATGAELNNLSQYSHTLSRASTALDRAGQGLQSVGGVPLVGSSIGRIGTDVRRTARSVRSSAKTTRSSVSALSLLIGLSIALIPTLPLLAVWLPVRWSIARDRKSVREALDAEGLSPPLRQFLARRALDRLPYRRLLELSSDPWGDVTVGETAALADTELAYLGLDADLIDRTASP